MYVHNINPTLLSLGPLEVRFYGIVYVLGFFLTVWWIQYLSTKGKFTLTKDDAWDLGTYLMVGMLAGARFFMIFWQPSYYLSNPLNLLKFWEGGMSFHGGFVGAIIGCYLFTKKHKIDFYKLADALSVPTIFALALGRIANFINGELVGRPSRSSLCVVFPQYDQVCRHPSTLYAAGKRFVIFGWLLYLSLTKEFKRGFIFWNFVFWEGLGRFIVDFYRENAVFWGLSLGQWFSAIMVLIALYSFSKFYKGEWARLLKRSSG